MIYYFPKNIQNILMQRTLVLALICLPIFLNAQKVEDKGLRFENNISWNQIKAKAKFEKKYIFIDCYTTWCMPCKMMDKNVYPLEQIGEIVNSKFLSVKVQMDTSKRDDEGIKKWYSIAHDFQNTYNIDAFPTFLFFSPEGKLVHRGVGLKSVEEFMKLVSDAVDSNKQIYTQLERYQRNIRNYQALPSLAKNVYSVLQNRELAYKIAEDYNKNYLNNLTNDQLFVKDNIEFITWYPKVLQSGDRYFYIFLNDAKKIDSIIGQPGFSSKVVDFVISKEEIFPKIYENSNGRPIGVAPDWNGLLGSVQRKYGKERAERNILDAQVSWYIAKKEWEKAIKYNVIKIEKQGIDTSFFGRFGLNNFCYSLVFKHSSDTSVLKKAIIWMEQILKFEPNNASQIDTYAGLLYKIGKTLEAITWQEKAVRLSPEDEEIREHLNKMRMKEPTWVNVK